MERISENYMDNVRWFDDTLGAGRSCDMVCRDLQVGGRRGRIWVIDGFGGDAILERMGAFWLALKPEAGGDHYPDAGVHRPVRDLHGGERQF